MDPDIAITLDKEPRRSVVARRLKTVSVVVLLFAVVTAAFPLLLLAAAAVDAARALARSRPWVGVRLLTFGWVYLAAEVWGVLGLAAIWLFGGAGRGRHLMLQWTYALQGAWAATLFAALRGLFGLRLEVEGADDVAPGAILLFFRHASIVDNLLPARLVTRPHGIRLRYVLKRELLSDPALDIAGNRLPNYFVRRGSGESRAEIARVRLLAQDLGPRDGVLIYPEGTRFTPAKQARALEVLAGRDATLHARARHFRYVLPPRLGGPMALLDSGADVVVCAHWGLDGFAHVADVWSGKLVGRTVRVRFWRVPATEIPAERSERVDWLYETWRRVDEWIADAAGREGP